MKRIKLRDGSNLYLGLGRDIKNLIDKIWEDPDYYYEYGAKPYIKVNKNYSVRIRRIDGLFKFAFDVYGSENTIEVLLAG